MRVFAHVANCLLIVGIVHHNSVLAQAADATVAQNCILQGVSPFGQTNHRLSLRFGTLLEGANPSSYGSAPLSVRSAGIDNAYFTADDRVATILNGWYSRAEFVAPGVVAAFNPSALTIVRYGSDRVWGTSDDTVSTVENFSAGVPVALHSVSDRTLVWSSTSTSGRDFRYCSVDFPSSAPGACEPNKPYRIVLPPYAPMQFNAEYPVGFALPGVVGAAFLYNQGSFGGSAGFPAGTSFALNGGPLTQIFPPVSTPPYNMVWSILPADYVLFRDWLPGAKWRLGSFADIANVNGRLPLNFGTSGDVQSVTISDDPGPYGIPSVIYVTNPAGGGNRHEYVPALAVGLPNQLFPVPTNTAMVSGPGAILISAQHVMAPLAPTQPGTSGGWAYWICQ